MSWLAHNWFFVLFGLLFIVMHLGHGHHGGHGGHGSPAPERTGSGDASRPVGSSEQKRPADHQH